MTDSITPLRFNVEQIGKHVKSSKKRFTWELSVSGKQHSIVLEFSFISGKVKVMVNRKTLLQNQLPANTSFQYPFTLDGNSLNVIQQGESFQLRINNKVFSHLYNQAKTNKEFKKYQDEIKDFKVNENQFQAKKLTLSIGGVGGGMKKKPTSQSSEGHNWNAFGQDQMSGFPNYFQGQSVSTTSSLKVQQPSQGVIKKTSSLLDEDSGPNLTPKPVSQNILDFQQQLQRAPTQPQQTTKGQEEFSTMQMMFQTMNVNPVSQQSNPSVVIDNSEVDFFSSVQEQKPNPPEQIDFFSGINTQTVNIDPVASKVTQPSAGDFNTMQYMFTTNQISANNGSQVSFNTSSPQKTQTNQQSNIQTINQPANFGLGLGMNTGINTNSQQVTKPVQQQINANNFSTLQGLFATNTMGISQQTQPTTFNSNSTGQKQPTVNLSLNTQHFATQGIPSQGFGTQFSVNAQQFGTQNLMGQQQGFSQQSSFLQQQKPTVSQTSQQPLVTSQLPVQTSAQINIGDFNSMQMLFKTNAAQTNLQQQPSSQQITQKSPSDSFSQQFATIGGSSTQSPNNMFMNTYGGSNNQANLSFDLSLGGNPQQFNTSVNPSMMKKKTTPEFQQSANSSDLL